jgi:hypothetical protein
MAGLFKALDEIALRFEIVFYDKNTHAYLLTWQAARHSSITAPATEEGDVPPPVQNQTAAGFAGGG